MKIFAADIYHSGRSTPGSRSIHTRVTEHYIYPHVLESFHYADAPMLRAIRHNKQKIFLDSGAFSMFTQNVKVDLGRYAGFIESNHDVIEIASNLDAIGKGNEQLSYDRLKQLERRLGPGKVIPVHHARDDDVWLQRYIDEGYDYIALGGMVPETTPALKQWLDHVWHYYLTNPDGTARIKVHGFGLTTRALMYRYPWASIDSTTWVTATRFGGMLMDFPQDDGSVKDAKIDFSERSGKRYDMHSWHFGSLKPDEQQMVLARLQQFEACRIRHPDIEAAFKAELGVEMGFNPQALGKSYGMRDIGNLEYFKRAMARRVDTFIRKQPTLWDPSV